MNGDDNARLKACENALEDIRKAVFEENLTLSNLKRRIAHILRGLQHDKVEPPP
jgi:hypothetical protein